MFYFLLFRLFISLDTLYLFCNIIIGKLLCDFFRPVNDKIRNARKLCHLNTVALVRSALYDLP